MSTFSNIRTLSSRLVALLLALVVAATGCDFADYPGGGGDDPEEEQPTVVARDVIHLHELVMDENGQNPTAATDPATPLYEFRKMNPILTPDGKPVTLALFDAVHGEAEMMCTEGGTYVGVKAQGLIPNGAYSIWIDVFKEPGYEPTYANEIGVGALGPQDGSEGGFTATADGMGQIEAITPGGSLSMLGEVGGCMLTDEYEVLVMGAYHMDGQTHGGDLGPEGSAIEQFAWSFK